MSDYQFEITHRPDFTFLNVDLNPEQTIKVEASSMATMSTNVEMKTKLRGASDDF